MSQTPSLRRTDCYASPVIEPLEGRKLLTARVTQFFFDNRGRAELYFNQALDRASLRAETVNVFTAGPDGDIGTDDDVEVPRSVVYQKGRSISRLTITARTGAGAELAPETAYRVQLAGVQSSSGEALDGEFNAPDPQSGRDKWSGNGQPGGNFDVSTTGPDNLRARFTTDYGFINVGLYRKGVATTNANFKHYADEKAWDRTFFHRSTRKNRRGEGLDIIQGGGFILDQDGDIQANHTEAGIATQFGRPNVRGTIAMARTPSGATPNSNQWFFNVKDNEDLDDRPDADKFSVFGTALDSASISVMDAINALTIVDAAGGDTNSAFGEVPVRDPLAGVGRPFNLETDLVIVHRVAMMMDVEGTDIPGGAPQGATNAAATAAVTANAPAPKFATRKVSKARVFDEVL